MESKTRIFGSLVIGGISASVGYYVGGGPAQTFVIHYSGLTFWHTLLYGLGGFALAWYLTRRLSPKLETVHHPTIMKSDNLRMRLWVTSLFVGCVISGLFTAFMWVARVGFYFPPFWPGLFFAWAVIIVSHGEAWAHGFGIGLTTIGNAVFYAFVCFRVIDAEIASRGRLGRYFLR